AGLGADRNKHNRITLHRFKKNSHAINPACRRAQTRNGRKIGMREIAKSNLRSTAPFTELLTAWQDDEPISRALPRETAAPRPRPRRSSRRFLLATAVPTRFPPRNCPVVPRICLFPGRHLSRYRARQILNVGIADTRRAGA